MKQDESVGVFALEEANVRTDLYTSEPALFIVANIKQYCIA